MARKPKQDRARNTVDVIVQAGFNVVGKYGINAVTTRHIADEAGVGIGSLYEYFDNKEAVFKAMNDQFVQDILAMLRDLKQYIVRISVKEFLYLLFQQYIVLLQKNQSRYLKFFKYSKFSPQIESALMELVFLVMMQNPQYSQIPKAVSIFSMGINSGIYNVIRYLRTPNPDMAFMEFVDHLVLMLTSFLDAELALQQQLKQ